MRRSFRPPLVSLVCLSLLLHGCQTWARYDVPTETAPSSAAVAGGRAVRVSMRDGTQLMMWGTRVIGDSVVGDGTGFLSSKGTHGNVVHQMLANYQFNHEGGDGDMRLVEFKNDVNSLTVRTYSPVLNRYNEAPDQQFALKMDEPYVMPPSANKRKHHVSPKRPAKAKA